MSKKFQGKQGETKSAKNKDEMAQLKDEMKQLISERKDQTQTITDLKKKVKKLESELTTAKHGLERKAPEFLDVISGDTMENHMKKLTKLEEENERLKARHNGAESGNKEEIENMREEIKRLKSERDKFEEEKNTLVKRNQEIHDQLHNKYKKNQPIVSKQDTDTEQDEREIDKLKENLQKHINELKQSKEDGENLKEELEKLKSENAENNTLKKKNQKQEEENTTDMKMVDFEKVNEENKALKEKVKSLKEDIGRLTDDNERLKAKISNSTLSRPSTPKSSKNNAQGKSNTKTDDKPELVNILGIHRQELKTVMEAREKLQEQVDGMTKEREKLQTKVQQLESTQNTHRETRNSEKESKIENLTKEKEKLQEQLDGMTEERNKKNEEIKELMETLQNESNNQEQTILMLKKEKEDLKREMETRDVEMKHMKQQNRQSETRGQKKENKKGDSSPAEKISRLEEEVEGLRNRLSKIAGAQLVDNNPAIADLSDPNRPLSLGEKFSELYDNEWTDAMEELSDSLDERAVIKQLLDIVVDSYQFCCEQSNKFMERINGTLKSFSPNLVSEMPKEISKTNKDFRKSLAVHCVYHLQEEFTNKKSRANAGQKTKDYMKKCVQVCWFMTVQDPKVVINHKVTGQFDEDRFKAYTKKGKHVDYLVWPALHLHEGGPMIGKGVVQGK